MKNAHAHDPFCTGDLPFEDEDAGPAYLGPDGPVSVEDDTINRPGTTAMITRGVCRFLVAAGYAPLLEFTLANGRRADIAAINKAGDILIVEVKSCRADFETDQKWGDYTGFCDQFYFAVDPAFPLDIVPADQGLFLADAYGAHIKTPAMDHRLSPARRKALTVRLARQSMLRNIHQITA